MGEHEAIPAGVPTQVAHPLKATLRTAAANAAAILAFLALAIPVLQETVGPYLPEGWAAWLAGAALLVGALGTAFTRLMAIAKAQGLLAKIGLGTGVEKEPVKGATPGGI